MSVIKKIAVGIGVIGAGGLATWLVNLRRTGAQLEPITRVLIHKASLKDGITLRIDSILKNPTKTGLKIKFPFVKLYYKDKLIGSSQVVNQNIEVPSFGEARIEKIMVHLPTSGLLSSAAGLLTSLMNNEKPSLKVKTTSTIDLGIKQVPYETEETISLTPPILT